ncbi:MAG: NADH-quinone oxidoreductase subunit NuoE [Bacteroidales bacterium]
MDRIDQILNDFQQVNKDSLIPVLQAVQDEFGYLSETALEKIGGQLKMPVSKIYGLATFYNQFTFTPQGKYHIKVCNGTACHIDHSVSILKELKKHLGIADGETTRDGMFSLEVVACIGACGQSPVIAINDAHFPRLQAGQVKEVLEGIRSRHR